MRDDSAPPPARVRGLVLSIATLAVLALAGTIAGFAHLDHCATLGCDFSGFHLQGRLLFEKPLAILPTWRLPPFAALVFAPLGPLRLRYALAIWEGLSLAMGVLLARLCARELTIWGPRARVLVAAALVAASLPVIHCLKWGQVSLLVVVPVLTTLVFGRGTGFAAGLAGAFKIYPLAYLLAPLMAKRWRPPAWAGAIALAAGVVLPWLVLGPERASALLQNVTARAAIGGDWIEGHSSAWLGGQSLAASIERWFHDGGHAGLNAGAAPARLVPLPGAVATTLAALATLAVIVATAWRLARRDLPSGRAAALCLTGVTLVLPPGWHHYFVFLPYAQAVLLGDPRGGWRRAVSLASLAISAAPLVLLGAVDHAYFFYSAWGGTTLAALLVWSGLVARPPTPAPAA